MAKQQTSLDKKKKTVTSDTRKATPVAKKQAAQIKSGTATPVAKAKNTPTVKAHDPKPGKGAVIGAQATRREALTGKKTAQLSSGTSVQPGVANWIGASGGKGGKVGKGTDPFLEGLLGSVRQSRENSRRKTGKK